MESEREGKRCAPSIEGNSVCSSLLSIACSLLSHRYPPIYDYRSFFVPRKQDVHTIITLTDNAPQGLNDSLSSFPRATKVSSPPLYVSTLHGTINFVSKLGLFCSSTPFVTGRPYTLIHNGSVHSSGAVGIALSAGPRPALKTAYPGLRAITPPLKVTA
jgi:hypothetical protein